jgi:hypothetical protein
MVCFLTTTADLFFTLSLSPKTHEKITFIFCCNDNFHGSK